MPGRKYQVGDGYRYGMNGQEKDDEILSSNNSYNFGARMYDSRIGKWFSVDRYTGKYPNLSPYNFTANNPIIFVDKDGNDFIIFIENTKTTDVIFEGNDKKMVNRSVEKSYSVQVIKAAGPDVYLWKKTSDYVTGKMAPTFIETSHTNTTDSYTKLDPTDMNASAGVTESVSQFCDGLFGFKVGDYDKVTVGKFMLSDPNFSRYLKSRNSKAADWEISALAVEWGDAMSKLVRTATFSFLGYSASQISALGVTIPRGGVIFNEEEAAAAYRLGFFSEDVAITNGAAEIPITYMDKMASADINIVANSLRNHGATSIVVNSGPITNTKLASTLQKLSEAGKTVNGFNVTATGNPDNMFILEKTIK